MKKVKKEISSPSPTPLRECSMCTSPSTLLCPLCTSMAYCSRACQARDHSAHSTLCTKLAAFPTHARPSPSHFRCIYFPADEPVPRFIWLAFTGPHTNDLTPDRDELKRFIIGGSPSGGDMEFDCHRELRRTFGSRLVVQHDNNFLGNRQPANRSVGGLLGAEVADRLRGPLLVHRYKYRIGDGVEEWEEEDRGLGRKPLVPLDVNCMCLPPILSFLKWRATSTDEYGLKDDGVRVKMEEDGVGVKTEEHGIRVKKEEDGERN